MNKYQRRGGKTDIRNRLYRSKEWKLIRQQRLELDNYSCYYCGAVGQLSVHHVKDVINYPDLMLDIDNLRTACFKCHGREDGVRNKAQKVNKKPVNRFLTTIKPL